MRSQNFKRRLLTSPCPSVLLSVHPPAWKTSAPTGGMFMKFDIWVFFENVTRKFKFHSNLTRITATSYDELCKGRVKVKVTLVQALRLCTGRRAHRGSRSIALPFHDHGTRRGWGFSVTTLPLFTPRKDLVPIVQEVRWAPGPVWISAKNLAPTGIGSPNRPGRSHSLYRIRYPAHKSFYNYDYISLTRS